MTVNPVFPRRQSIIGIWKLNFVKHLPTGEAGNYSVPFLPVGRYEVVAGIVGFRAELGRNHPGRRPASRG